MKSATHAPALPAGILAATPLSRFTASDGVGIACYAWKSAGDDTRPPVVLHHGFAASAALNWVAPGIVQKLLDSGRDVLALDARGHGASDKPHDPSLYGEARMAQDLREWLESLGVSSFDLFGYSMGAVVSLLLASSGSRVRRLVVGGVGEGVLLSGGVDMRVMDRDAVVEALLAADPSLVRHPGASLVRAFAERTGSDLRALAAQALRMHAVPIPLQQIAAPTLVLAGSEDLLAMYPERLAAAIPGAGHLVLPGDHLGVLGQPALAEAAIRFLGQGQSEIQPGPEHTPEHRPGAARRAARSGVTR